LQGLLLRVPVKHTLGVLCIQTATHTRVSQCGVCWCSLYQGFPSTVRAHSPGMASGGLYMSTDRDPTHIHAPLVSFHSFARSVPDTLLWAPVVCPHFVALILSVLWLVRCCGRLFFSNMAQAAAAAGLEQLARAHNVYRQRQRACDLKDKAKAPKYGAPLSVPVMDSLHSVVVWWQVVGQQGRGVSWRFRIADRRSRRRRFWCTDRRIDYFF